MSPTTLRAIADAADALARVARAALDESQRLARGARACSPTCRAARIAEAMSLAPWVNDLDDPCLYEVVLEALTARVSAVRRHGNARTIEAGDKALELVSSKRVTGEEACKKAAVALRKYTRSYGGIVE